MTQEYAPSIGDLRQLTQESSFFGGLPESALDTLASRTSRLSPAFGVDKWLDNSIFLDYVGERTSGIARSRFSREPPT